MDENGNKYLCDILIYHPCEEVWIPKSNDPNELACWQSSATKTIFRPLLILSSYSHSQCRI